MQRVPLAHQVVEEAAAAGVLRRGSEREWYSLPAQRVPALVGGPPCANSWRRRSKPASSLRRMPWLGPGLLCPTTRATVP